MVQFASYLRCVLAKTRLIFSRIKGPTEFLRTPGSNTRNNAAKIYWTKNVEKGCEMYHGKLEKLNILQNIICIISCKITLPFLLYFESMYYKYLPCQILSHDFDEKSDFLNYEFSTRLPAITQFKNGRVRKRELGQGRM